MTHIIGTPPKPKGGATFADVIVGGVCELPGNVGMCWKLSEQEARQCRTGARFPVPADRPVVLLDITPIDPEPDPAVTTYGELYIGEVFAFADEPQTLLRRTDEGHVYLGCGQHFGQRPDETPVRRVAASVVIHDPSRTLVQVDGDTVLSIGPVHTLADLPALCSQIADVLAKQAASPESALGTCWETGEACTQGCKTTCGKTGLDVEPAEDRSKPAPGYAVSMYNSWRWRVVLLTGVAHYPADQTEQGAIRETWTLHDAQKAGKGGES